ncbi:MAG: GLUG motif-containing protein [Clostridia bacterium]
MKKRLFNTSFTVVIFILMLNIMFVSGQKTTVPEIPNFEENMKTLTLLEQYDYAKNYVLDTGEVGFDIGTDVYPYIISNVSQLMEFANLINNLTEPFKESDVHYKLVQNINLNGVEWIPVGNSSLSSFNGVFDGNYQVISGLTITTDYSYQGFFGHANNATIKNVFLENSNITGKTFMGGVVGFLSNSTLENSYASSNIQGLGSVGGLVGSGINSTIKNCYATGSVKAYGYVGGIVGDLSGNVENCYATNTVYGDVVAGGIAGYSQGSIKNSFAINSSIGGIADVARIVGSNSGALTNNYSLADLFTTTMNVNQNGYAVNILNGKVGTYSLTGEFDLFDWENVGQFNTNIWELPIKESQLLPTLKIIETQIPSYVPEDTDTNIEDDEAVYYKVLFYFSETDFMTLQTNATGKISAFPTKTGYEVTWVNNNNEIITEDTVFTQNTVLIAELELITESELSPMWVYGVTITETQNGTVQVDDCTKVANQDVTIVVKPNVGYKVSQITILKSGGNTVEVQDNKDGTYTYTQPFSDIVVDIIFEQGMQFSDVNEDDWFYEYVENMSVNGLMYGISNDLFSPYTTTDNAMMITILWRLAEGTTFSSDEEDYYATALAWAVENNILTEEDLVEFVATEKVTREQIATYLYTYEGSPKTIENFSNNFADSLDISEWAVEAMDWAVLNEIFIGNIKGYLNPNAEASRAEIATILSRYLENVK